MKNRLLGSRYTDAIKNDSGTANKMSNIYNSVINKEGLRGIHSALYGLLTAGYDISNMRKIEELEKYVNLKKSRGQLLNVSSSDIKLYHKLFVIRFGK
ncbi:hypothetical protein PP207_gp25 [Streptococcus phage CHPC572]|uniref:Uncharacterized protein n=1 Tax=Streptococcus phage CHPC572 TaxID=2365035 RepID=A0A3G8F6P9_9CAUD|nr:hypothetical protein PP207_gp25 [Streptococcus phage CHPC572]AZF90369.1 hypothetical protein CHPC572_0025 [Streptococcus phage CHPC572]